MLLLGYWQYGRYGLITGFLAGQLAESLVLLARAKGLFKTVDFTLADFRRIVFSYKEFPLFTLPSAFILRAALEIPVNALKAKFSEQLAGQYSFLLRVIGSPIFLACQSLSNVYRQTAMQELEATGSCRNVLLRLFYTGLALGIIPCTVLFLFGESIFAFVFGDEWRVAGGFAAILAPLFLLQIAVSPISSTIELVEKNHIRLYLHLLLLAGVALSFYLGSVTGQVELALILYSVAYTIKYLLEFYISYRVADTAN